ncbi:MAG: anti-sigma factor, partial [Rhizobiales bacterium]|nr:anti-sigma factor [Hyphomicrobiales bacterium]
MDRLEAYALGTLAPDERALVAWHLDGCTTCRRRSMELADVAAMLPEALAAAAPLMPPAALKELVLAAVESLPAASDTNGRIVATSPATTRRSVPSPDEGSSPWGRLVGRSGSWGAAGALVRLAAAVLLLGSLGWSVRLGLALERERALNAEMLALVGQQEVVFEVVDSDKQVRRVLRATRTDGCAPEGCPYGKLFTRPDLPHVVVMAARLPPEPTGQVYHLWLTDDGRTKLSGTLETDDKGFGLLVFDAAQDGPAYDAAELTLQPA